MKNAKFEKIINFIRNLYKQDGFINLHQPVFGGNEKNYLNSCIDSSFVSSVGKFVDDFEKKCAEFTGAEYAIAVVNGTQALFTALRLAEVGQNDEVITQALTFAATAHAIKYTGAEPIFLDVDKETLGLSPDAIKIFLEENCEVIDGLTINKTTKKTIRACVPMHTFGHPCRIDEITAICEKYNIIVIEDAAESLGSFYKKKHTGLFGKMAALSFNGNKTVTTGGGGMILTNNESLAKRAIHITKTAKIPHSYLFYHDELGYNFRMPNINAALGLAQMEQLNSFLENKRETAYIYSRFFEEIGVEFVKEPLHAHSNYWLNAIYFETIEERNAFLSFSNENGIMARPAWELMTTLPHLKDSYHDKLTNSYNISERLVNIPSGVRL